MWGCKEVVGAAGACVELGTAQAQAQGQQERRTSYLSIMRTVAGVAIAWSNVPAGSPRAAASAEARHRAPHSLVSQSAWTAASQPGSEPVSGHWLDP